MDKKPLLLLFCLFIVWEWELCAQINEKGEQLVGTDGYDIVANNINYYVKLISKTEKTIAKGIKWIKTKEKFIDEEGNEFIRIIEKEVELGEVLSIEGGFILDQASFDMSLSKNKHLRRKMFRIVKSYIAYTYKTESKNPLILKISSSPEYLGTYLEAKKYNLDLSKKRLLAVAKLIRLYALKITPKPIKLKIELSEDGMNFPSDTRKLLDYSTDDLGKNIIYQNFLKGGTQEEFKKLRIAEIYFEIEPVIKINKVDIIPYLAKKNQKALLVLIDPSASMANDISETNAEIKAINKIREKLNHALIKVKPIIIKKIIGDTEAEMHLETLDSIIRNFPKRGKKNDYDKIIIYTDEPDCSYRNNYKVNVEKRYNEGMRRAVKLLNEKGYELLFVINNPEDSQDKRIIHLSMGNLDEFCDVFYDRNRRKNENKLLTIDTQRWYNTQIKKMGKKVTPAEFLQNQMAIVRDL